MYNYTESTLDLCTDGEATEYSEGVQSEVGCVTLGTGLAFPALPWCLLSIRQGECLMMT